MNEEYSSYGQYPYEDEYPPVQDQYYNVPVKQKKIPSGGLLSGGIPTVLVWVAAVVLAYAFITSKTTVEYRHGLFGLRK